jgi:hypothetical protein
MMDLYTMIPLVPSKIPLFFSNWVDLYKKTPPARPTNNTKTPTITLSKLVLVIIG